MKTLDEYLNELEEKCGSAYAMAKTLEISKQSMSAIKKGGGIKDETALKIANALNVDAGEVLIAAAASRSNGEVKKVWENVSKRAGIAAGVALVAVVAHYLPGNEQAAEFGPAMLGLFTDNIHYAKSKKRKNGVLYRLGYSRLTPSRSTSTRQ